MVSTKTRGTVIALVLFFAGSMFGIAIGGSGGAFPPSGHKAVIDKIVIEDTTRDYILRPKCVASGNVEFGAPVDLKIFNVGTKYQHSTWAFQRLEDTEFIVTLWGPGSDQSTILVEFGRLGSNAFEISVDGKLEIIVNSVSASPATGYYWLYVNVS